MNNDAETIALLKQINENLKSIKAPPIWRSFFQGLLTGFGTVVGATILIALAIGLLQQFITIPLIGEFVKDILDVVQAR